MMSNSNVTVVIPCYNDGRYIMEALESILNQTVKADEIIIVDDGSGKETIKILKTISSPNVQIIYQENKGVSSARNRAISLAKTDYILNLDSDDYFEPTFIEKAVQVLNENENIGVVGCWYKVFGNKERNNNIIKPLGGNVRNFLVKNNALGTSMFRKKCWEEISGYDENMLYGYEDWDFWISILENNWKMHIINEVLFNYRIKGTSRDQTAEQKYDYEIRRYIFLKHKETYLRNFEEYTLQLLEKNSVLNKKSKQLKNSANYKIGTLMMNPLRVFGIITNIFKR